MDYVIGSGPSGISCALALLRRGRAVTMLDGGGELETERRQAVERLRISDPGSWRGPAIDFLKEGVAADRKGVSVKRIFGSGYPYRDAERFMPTEKIGVDTRSSLAAGGFSTVWGAAILPFRQADVADWPIGVEELVPHYEKVMQFLDTSVTDDDLTELFPLYTEDRTAFRRSRQADALLRDLEQNRRQLRAEGIWFGASRLAARPGPKAGRPGCSYCGLCMYGCPNGLIYSTADTLPYLESFPHFRRVAGVIVERVAESSSSGVRIFGCVRQSGEPVELAGDRVFLAAGTLASTRIMLRSLDAYDRTLVLKNSQYFLLPMLRYAAVSGVQDERLHTLAQTFLEICDPLVSKNTVHLQVYTYNDLYLAALKKTLGPAFPFFVPALGAFLGRMLTVQGYLHSDSSPSIAVTLQRRKGLPDLLHQEVQPAMIAEANATLRRVVRKLSRNSKWLRAKALGPLLNKPAAGHGFHVGGTFPMSKQPTGDQTDLLGRPIGFQRVHLVDSSVLPSIPATTITFSVMANAHRIGSQAE